MTAERVVLTAYCIQGEWCALPPLSPSRPLTCTNTTTLGALRFTCGAPVCVCVYVYVWVVSFGLPRDD